MRKMQAGPLLSLSPSFNSYSSSTGNLADIAARVVSEFRRENSGSDAAFYLEDDDVDHLWFHAELDQRRPLDHHDHDHHRDDHDRDDDVGDDDDDDDDGEEENEFEFAFVCREPTTSPISADEIFYNGQIKPVYYPLFGKNLILEESPGTDAVVVSGTDGKNDKSALPPPPPPPRRRQPLRKLMVEEREATTSCSSSEADELDRLQHGTYCVWKPRNGGDAAGGKKSKSTGTSKRWKFRDLLGRSFNSDRKDRGTIVVIAAPGKKVVSKGDKVTGKGTAVAAGKTEAKNDVVSAPEKAGKEEDKRRSYKQDLVGFLANVNGLSRNLHPF